MRFLTSLALLALTTSVFAQSSWTVGRTGIAGVTAASGIAFGNGRFVATLSGSVGTPTAAWSTDGITWTASSVTSPNGGSIAFAQGWFYIAGQSTVLRSMDGETWQVVYRVVDPISLRGIATNGESILVGNVRTEGSRLLFSRNGTEWNVTDPLPGASDSTFVVFGDVVYGTGRFFVTYYVSPADRSRSDPAAVWTSDGRTWNHAPGLLDFVYPAGGGGYVMTFGGFSEVLRSNDGEVFTRHPVPHDYLNSGRPYFAGGRMFQGNTLAASTDLLTWRPLAPVTLPYNAHGKGVAYGNGRYVAVGTSTQPTAEYVATLVFPAAPIVQSQPRSQSLSEHADLSLSVEVENTDGNTVYRWHRNGAPIAGATSATFRMDDVTTAGSGRYAVAITNAEGTTFSEPAFVTVVPFERAGRIANLSVLANLDAADSPLTLGFSISGSGSKPMLLRAMGPSLAQFGIANANADPKLAYFKGATQVDQSDNWNSAVAVSSAVSQVSAFPFIAPDSKDAALLVSGQGGLNSIAVTGVGSATGPVIAEIYDATATFTRDSSRLANASVMHRVSDSGVLTLGFVITGDSPRTVLIRAIGPSLSQFGISGMSDPTLRVYRQGASAPFESNDNWGGVVAARDAATAVLAFGIDATSKDAATLVTLEPGGYTAEAKSANTSGGLVLIEVYEVP